MLSVHRLRVNLVGKGGVVLTQELGWTVSGTGKRFSCGMDSFGNLVRFMVHFSVV